MIRLVLLVSLVSLVWATQLICQTGHYGSASENRYTVDLLPEGVDPARFPVISLQLDTAWSPVVDDRCPVRRHDDRLQMAWGDLGVEFAQYPVKCGEKHNMNFSVSTLGTKRWDNRVQRVDDGSVFMPQMGREGMLSVVSRMGDVAHPLPLQFRLMSGSLIRLESLNMTVCFYDLDGLLAGQEEEEDEELPTVVPFHDCVLRDHTGFCSTNFGYVASKDVVINVSKHHDANRFSPAKWHSDFWQLPEVFEKGYHPNQFKAQWPCRGGSDYSPYRVHWHLNGTLATAEYSYGASCKMTEGIHKMTEAEENDLISDYSHDDGIVFAPYYSQYNPKFAERNVDGAGGAPVWSECHDECCDGWCSSCSYGCDDWWAFGLFCFLLLGMLTLILVVGCVGPWWGLEAAVPSYYDHSHQMAYATHPEHIHPVPGSVPTIVSVDHVGYGQVSKTQ